MNYPDSAMEKSCEETVADCDENSVPLAFGELEPPNLSGASVTVPQKHKGGRPRKGVKKIKPFRPPPVPRNINKHKWDHITDAGQRKSERKTTSIDINSLILPVINLMPIMICISVFRVLIIQFIWILGIETATYIKSDASGAGQLRASYEDLWHIFKCWSCESGGIFRN